MKKIQKLCVTSSIGQIDSSLINYSKMLTFSFANTINTIKFLYLKPNYNLPKSILKSFPALIKKTALMEDSQRLVKDIYGYKAEEIKFSFINDNGIQSFLDFDNSFFPDLYLIGINNEKQNKDLSSLLLTQAIPKNILLVPEGTASKITNILVPIDFSQSSFQALSTALYFSKKYNATIEALYSYDIPSSYHLTGKSYTEFATIIKTEIKGKFEKFEKQLGCSIPLSIKINNKKNISEKILFYANEHTKDFIIIGYNEEFLGKITEELLLKNVTIPFFIVKN